jgi:hypothetical protein
VALIISVNANWQPKDLLRRRKGRSLMPAKGASRSREGIVVCPIVSIINLIVAHSLVKREGDESVLFLIGFCDIVIDSYGHGEQEKT